MKAKLSLVLISLALGVSLLPGAENAAPPKSFMALGRFQVLFPSDQVFKDVYGSSLNSFGLELRRNIGSLFAVWAEAAFLSQKGSLTFTGEETRLSLIPLEAGLLVRLKEGTWTPYAGVGAGIFILKEESDVLGKSTSNSLGFCLLAGIDFDLASLIFIDARVKYQVCKTGTTDPGVSDVDLGGLVVSGGIGIRF